jgi:DNA-binding response OmpR family regulator
MFGRGTDSAKTVLIVDNQPRETAALRAGAIKTIEEHPPGIVLLEASLSDLDSVEVVAFIRSDLRTCRF